MTLTAEYKNLAKGADGPPLSQTISVIAPSPLKDQARLLTKIVQHPELSTNGITLVHVGKTVVYDVKFLRFNPGWIDGIIDLSNQQLPPTLVKQIRRTANFYHAAAPNVGVAQQASTQFDLAVQFVQMLEVLMPALEAPVVLLRPSAAVVTLEAVKRVTNDLNAANMISFFVTINNSGHSLYSVGMHQLGYADVEIPLTLVPSAQAFALIIEILNWQLVNNLHNLGAESAYDFDNHHYRLHRMANQRFTEVDDVRGNPFGVWHLTTEL